MPRAWPWAVHGSDSDATVLQLDAERLLYSPSTTLSDLPAFPCNAIESRSVLPLRSLLQSSLHGRNPLDLPGLHPKRGGSGRRRSLRSLVETGGRPVRRWNLRDGTQESVRAISSIERDPTSPTTFDSRPHRLPSIVEFTDYLRQSTFRRSASRVPR